MNLMQLLDTIRSSTKKRKVLLVELSEKAKKDKSLLNDFTKCLEEGNPVEKGICMEILEYVTHENPEAGVQYIDCAVVYLNYESPLVKWESARVIANLAAKYPEKAAKAIDKLMANTKDKGTVVRWSTALAIGEIAKYNKKVQSDLVKKMEGLIKKESNSGVKNVYLKALKVITKQNE